MDGPFSKNCVKKASGKNYVFDVKVERTGLKIGRKGKALIGSLVGSFLFCILISIAIYFIVRIVKTNKKLREELRSQQQRNGNGNPNHVATEAQLARPQIAQAPSQTMA